MQPPMLHTAYKVTTTRNAYGDYVASGTTTLRCHFRYITALQIQNNEVVQSDAMAWFEADSGIVKGDIVTIDDEHFKVEKVIHARRLRSTAVQFIKTELVRYGRIS